MNPAGLISTVCFVYLHILAPTEDVSASCNSLKALLSSQRLDIVQCSHQSLRLAMMTKCVFFPGGHSGICSRDWPLSRSESKNKIKRASTLTRDQETKGSPRFPHQKNCLPSRFPDLTRCNLTRYQTMYETSDRRSTTLINSADYVLRLRESV
jgi:hypothetical protein